MMRLCACFGVKLEIIEPCGFVFDDRKLRRAAMDYVEHLAFDRHKSWGDFTTRQGQRRLILLTTKADTPYHRFDFHEDDILLLGQESAGVPDEVHHHASARLVIPMQSGVRSLNVALSAAIILAEALRQTGGLS